MRHSFRRRGHCRQLGLIVLPRRVQLGNGLLAWTIPLGHLPYPARLGLELGVGLVGLGLVFGL